MRCFLCFLFIICQVKALKIEITQGQIQPIPIAITDFYGNDLSSEIAQVIREDLESSGLFNPLDKSSFIQSPVSLQQTVRFADWRLLNAQCLMTGKIIKENDKLKVYFTLYDVFKGEMMISPIELSSETTKWRKIAHMIADAIYERITGETGYFDTKIAFVDETGPSGRRTKVLMIADRDGFNPKQLTDGKNLVLTPRFSPSIHPIIYLEFINKKATVYLLDLQSNQKRSLGNFDGLSFAPRFSPDGQNVVMSLSKNGSTAIYTMNIYSNKLTRLTEHLSIDTSPCCSPDGQQIVFTSDRSGTEQIYVMDKQGDNVRRISFGEGSYSQPSWSPRGDLIAFTKQLPGRRFYIGVMNSDGTAERLIADGWLVESPTWAPNGRVLMFTKETQGGRKSSSRLYSIDLTGHNMRMMQTPNDASDPAWSPLLSNLKVRK